VASAVVLGPRRPATRAEALTGARAVQIATHGTPGRSAGRDLPTSALVERRLLATLAAGPPARLPRSLVDPATGLLRNNTEVTCRHDRARVFHCDVRLLFQPRSEGFRVDYRIDGSRPAVITWHRHRHG
jgi:hypothetical protein